MEQKVYIVLSQTGTLLSRIIKCFTNDKYNHASIAVDPMLEDMYSFGRKNPYNPVNGGFVKESIKSGTFKRFSKTKVLILELEITEEQHKRIKSYLRKMYRERNKYHYNYIGLFGAAIHVNYSAKNEYYCSEFVKAVLTKFDIHNSSELPQIIKPMHFINLDNNHIRYEGNLQTYGRIASMQY